VAQGLERAGCRAREMKWTKHTPPRVLSARLLSSRVRVAPGPERPASGCETGPPRRRQSSQILIEGSAAIFWRRVQHCRRVVPGPNNCPRWAGGSRCLVQGYLVHKKYPPPRTLQMLYLGSCGDPMGGGGGSYERGTPVLLGSDPPPSTLHLPPSNPHPAPCTLHPAPSAPTLHSPPCTLSSLVGKEGHEMPPQAPTPCWANPQLRPRPASY
jgi:hypothetical protein